jgi:hypothetical protein
MTDTSSKLAAMMGVVAIWAASETANRLEISSGGFPKGRRTVALTSAMRAL